VVNFSIDWDEPHRRSDVGTPLVHRRSGTPHTYEEGLEKSHATRMRVATYSGIAGPERMWPTQGRRSQVERGDVTFPLQQLLTVPGEGNGSSPQHICPIGPLQGYARVLFDEQHSRAPISRLS